MKRNISLISKKFNLLDCTLRDGGYYNNWNFSKSEIQKYVNSIHSTGIKYVELGFRFNEKKKIKGSTAYTNQTLIDSLKLPTEIKYGLMINAGDLISNNKINSKILKHLLNQKNTNKISFVRIACHEKEILKLKECFIYIRKLGLKIFVNLMQISEISLSSLNEIVIFLKENNIKYLYLADSLGCLTPSKLKKIIYTLNSKWKNEIGLHAHNNLKKALSNSLFAVKNNFNWIDSTITGMGRGPGNLKTEDIIKHTSQFKITKKFKSTKLYFEKLKKKYKWGPNKYYKFAAEKKIHPTYVQKILSDHRYKKNEYFEILHSLSKLNTKIFNPSKLDNSTYFISDIKKEGTWNPKSIFEGKNILILGPGKNLKIHKKKIEKIIKKKKFLVVSLNTFSSIREDLINLRVICHPMRLLSDIKKIKKLKSKFVMPLSSFTNRFKKNIKIKKKDIFDYGLNLKDDKIIVESKFCLLPHPLAIGYAISLSIAGKSKSITLAGFDGYSKSDSDFDNSEELLSFFVKRYFKNKVPSLTKSNFNFLKITKFK